MPGVTFFPTRARGQNFLHDRSVAERFVAAAVGGGAPGAIVEIGPGKGALTFPLLASGFRVLAIEVDLRLAGRLEEHARERGLSENLRVVVGDALELDLGAAIAGFGAAPPLPICGNLPFSVASPLLLRLIEGHATPGDPPLFDALTLTLQKEVADRVVARRGERDYSALSVVVQQAPRRAVLPNPPGRLPAAAAGGVRGDPPHPASGPARRRPGGPFPGAGARPLRAPPEDPAELRRAAPGPGAGRPRGGRPRHPGSGPWTPAGGRCGRGVRGALAADVLTGVAPARVLVSPLSRTTQERQKTKKGRE